MALPLSFLAGSKGAQGPRTSLTDGGSAAQQKAAAAAADADDARKRFGNAKSISSAQYNQEEDNATANYEKQVQCA